MDEQDPTLLTSLGIAFDSIVSKVLQLDKLDGLSLAQLKSFQRLYSQFSYRCRYTGCKGSVIGFPSEAAREIHEQKHIRRLFCPNSNCSRGRLGFKNRNELEAHRRLYHETTLLIPPRIRSRKIAMTEDIALSIIQEEIPMQTKLAKFIKLGENAKLNSLVEKLFPDSHYDKHETWTAEYNPSVRKSLEIKLRYTFDQKSVVTSGSFSRDGTHLVICMNHLVKVYLVNTGELVQEIAMNEDLIHEGNMYTRDVVFNSDGSEICAACDDGQLRVSRAGSLSA